MILKKTEQKNKKRQCGSPETAADVEKHKAGQRYKVLSHGKAAEKSHTTDGVLEDECMAWDMTYEVPLDSRQSFTALNMASIRPFST